MSPHTFLSHAHACPDELYKQPATGSQKQLGQQVSKAPRTSPGGASTPIQNSASSRPRETILSPQTRRLQLRNAGFRAPLLPARRVSPFSNIATPLTEASPTLSYVNDENSPNSNYKRTLYGENIPTPPTSILQEIGNSVKRKRFSPRMEAITIHEDPIPTTVNAKEAASSRYNENSNPGTPQSETPLNMTKLRETSLNERIRSSASPPLGRIKSRKRQQTLFRSPSSGASKYIEHLESELTSLNTKLDALTSPTTARNQSARLRDVTTQVQSLQNELSDWDKKFEERVRDEVQTRTAMDSALKIRFKVMEEELESRETKIIELERELETAQARAKNAESLELTNRDLSRRVDVLTGLLAQSPTRQDFESSSSNTPGDMSPPKRTPRPKSLMLPLGPTSPSRSAHAWSADVSGWNHRSGISPNMTAETVEECGYRVDSHSQISASRSPRSSMQSGYDPRMSFASRPTSFTSNSSYGVNWNFAMHSEEMQRSGSKQRKMRRFPSGNCSLKPLILPVAAALPVSHPVSAPVLAKGEAARRDISNVSLDPTTAFLSDPNEERMYTTPTNPIRRRSNSWAHREALALLEGRKIEVEPDDMFHVQSEGEESEDDVQPTVKDQDLPLVTQVHEEYPTTLDIELEIAQRTVEDMTASFGDTHVIRIKSPKNNLNALLMEDTTPKASTDTLREREISKSRRARSRTCSTPNTVSSITPRARPGSAMISASPRHMVPSLNTIISSSCVSPLNLARKILVNVWYRGSSRYGGVGWWLLGLIYGSRTQRKDYWTDWNAGESNVDLDACDDLDWHQASDIPKRKRSQRSRQSDEDRELTHPSRTPQKLQAGEIRLRHPSRVVRLDENGDVIPLSQQVISRKERLRAAKKEWSPVQCKDCVDPPSRLRLMLWAQFSLAIVLAVGVAIKDGPGVLLSENDPPQRLSCACVGCDCCRKKD